MASYKVLQDVEAEDKLLGPLTLRQFIYGAIAAINLYLCYFLATHKAGFMIAVFLPVALATGFFAFPWGRDQPTEIWALAKIRFALKPRRRIWNQDGIKELVTITAPKHIATNYTNGLSETEVRSRLHALASTIDSRGWVVKNANLNLAQGTAGGPDSDRLIAPSSLPQPVASVDIQASDDILDEQNNAGAQRLDSMINQSAKAHRNDIMQRMEKGDEPAKQPDNYWFLNQPAQAANIPANMVTFNTQVVTPGMPMADTGLPAAQTPTPDDQNLVAQLDAHKQVAGKSHLHTILPLSAQAAQTPPVPPPLPPIQQAAPLPPQPTAAAGTAQQQPPAPAAPTPPPVTPAQQTAILQLANNDDLNVATIAREAERSAAQDEVVIKLH